jgi:hypothetical protein
MTQAGRPNQRPVSPIQVVTIRDRSFERMDVSIGRIKAAPESVPSAAVMFASGTGGEIYRLSRNYLS